MYGATIGVFLSVVLRGRQTCEKIQLTGSTKQEHMLSLRRVVTTCNHCQGRFLHPSHMCREIASYCMTEASARWEISIWCMTGAMCDDHRTKCSMNTFTHAHDQCYRPAEQSHTLYIILVLNRWGLIEHLFLLTLMQTREPTNNGIALQRRL